MSSTTDKALTVVCPNCLAAKGKSCKHMGAERRGRTRSKPHLDRVRLAKAKMSKEVAEKIKRIVRDYQDEKKPVKKNPKEKLTTGTDAHRLSQQKPLRGKRTQRQSVIKVTVHHKCNRRDDDVLQTKNFGNTEGVAAKIATS